MLLLICFGFEAVEERLRPSVNSKCIGVICFCIQFFFKSSVSFNNFYRNLVSLKMGQQPRSNASAVAKFSCRKHFQVMTLHANSKTAIGNKSPLTNHEQRIRVSSTNHLIALFLSGL